MLSLLQMSDLICDCRSFLRDRGFPGVNLSIGAPMGTIAPPPGFDGKNPWPYTDLTNLKPTALPVDIQALVAKAVDKRAATVCIFPADLRVAATSPDLRRMPRMAMSTVVNFPHGKEDPSGLIDLMRRAHGQLLADEIDLVHPIAWAMGNEWWPYHNALRQAIRAASNTPVKVILETQMLTAEQIVKATLLCWQAGAAGVKTSTGVNEVTLSDGKVGKTHATVEHVRLMRMAFGNTDKRGRPAIIKASGGIKTTAQACEMLNNGATRIGASGMEEAAAGSGY